MWECDIAGCGFEDEAVEALLAHQANAHDRHQCAVCGTVVPDGYFAIRHAFSEHSRAEYLRHYDADADDVRRRETVLSTVESEADIEAVVQRLGLESDTTTETEG